MLYLLDSNVFITAHDLYYPIDSVPEYWEWLLYNCETEQCKIPYEMYQEIKDGNKPTRVDLLYNWASNTENGKSLLLNEEADISAVQTVLEKGYGENLTDVELEEIGQDPFIVAYALADIANRCVVTTEQSAPSKVRKNRKIPDVCKQFNVKCYNPFEFNKELGFRTAWRQVV